MRLLFPLLALLALPAGAQENPKSTKPRRPGLPRDIAAAHPDGKWKVRTRDLYRYLVRFHGDRPAGRVVLPDYMKQRLVQYEARRRKIRVTESDVDGWLDKLDARVKKDSRGRMDLDRLRQQQLMTKAEFERRARTAVLRQRLARAIYAEMDPSRKRGQDVSEDAVVLAIDRLYQRAPKVLDRKKLRQGVVARIGKIEITEYEYGRELSYALPRTEVANALRYLVLHEEVKLLLGNDDPPSADDLAIQKESFITHWKNRIGTQKGAPKKITLEMVEQVLKGRGLTLESAFRNPGFLAEARARAHFRRSIDDAALKKYYEANEARYGDQLRVARIHIAARMQNVPRVGKKLLNLHQGKALAESIWLEVTQGREDFGEVARRKSDDPEVIRRNKGEVPLWITAGTPGYEDTFRHANGLKLGEITKPWFSQGRGYVLVKLLERKKALGFESMKKKILADAAAEAYQIWHVTFWRAALKNEGLFER